MPTALSISHDPVEAASVGPTTGHLPSGPPFTGQPTHGQPVGRPAASDMLTGRLPHDRPVPLDSDPQTSAGELTQLLIEWRSGRAEALDRLMPLVYGELRRLAQFHMASERPGHTLQATAVVNEAYLRLLGKERPSWRSRAHFFAVASLVMRRILLDHARGRLAEKRGQAEKRGRAQSRGGAEAPPSIGTLEQPHRHPATLLALDAALQRFTALDPRAARVVELRYYGGLTIEDVAEVLSVGPATVIRDWRRARAWLTRELA